MTGSRQPAAADDVLALDDDALLAQCDMTFTRSGGPGGQHRNKVSSAVRLYHRPTGVTVQAYEERSQHVNRRAALARLRMKIACTVRRPVGPAGTHVPEVVQSCLFTPRKGPFVGSRRIQVGRKDGRYWPVVRFLLDVLAANEGRLSDAAATIGVTTSNFTSVLQDDRHALAAAQDIRKAHGLGAIR